MKIRLSQQKGAIAVEYLLLLVLMGIFVISNFDSIEGAVGSVEGSITSALGDVNSAIPSVTVANN